MRKLSIALSDSEYEAFERAAEAERRPVAQLVREAITLYREKLGGRTRLLDVPSLDGHRLVGALPSRAEIYEEIFTEEMLSTVITRQGTRPE